MRLSVKLVVCLAGWATFNAHAETVLSSNNPYRSIVTRNVFGLRTPQPVEEARAVEVPPKIALDGIMRITGQPQAVFKVPNAARAAHASTDEPFILTEGQQRDGVEVVHIDETAGSVTFSNHGILQIISLTNSSPVDIPTVAANDAFVPPHLYKPRMVGAIGGGRMPPYFGGGADNGGQGSQAPLTAEQQMEMIEAQRAYYNSQGDPESRRLARSLPPTALTPPDAFGP
jgi:hypothetical protein